MPEEVDMKTGFTGPVNKRVRKFTPNMEDFRVSLSYEGLQLKKSNKGKTIEDLKRKYTR